MWTLLMTFLKQIVRNGTLEVETADGRRTVIGDGTGKPLGLLVQERAAVRRLLLNPELALGELYSEGRLKVSKGTIYDIIELITQNLALQHPPGIARIRARFRRLKQRTYGQNTKLRSEQNVRHHYDLDRRFYDLFLDPDRQYSCAYFEHAGQSLEQAQLAKKRHIAAKLLLRPGDRVLDIGSGWGGLALYLAENCAVNVLGITLSEEQLVTARQGIENRQLLSSVEFNIQDYRNITETFDRIVSVGMFEHVGVSYYDDFFRTVADRLTNDGVMVLHAIGRIDEPGTTNPWINKYIFPGSYAPALSEVLPKIERAGLIVSDAEILRLHYAETLRLWRQRFLARRNEAVALTDDRFCRMWEFYLAACECGFRYCGLMVFQLQLTKRIDTVPLTRSYIAETEAALRALEGGNQPAQVAAE